MSKIISEAYIIEIGEEAAGIVTREKRGVRFHSAHRAYHALDGSLFATPGAAEKAARFHRRARAIQQSPSASAQSAI